MAVERVDVAILGGGLIGLALAEVLAGAGFAVAVIDRVARQCRAEQGFDARAYAVALGSERLLTATGIWPRVREHAQPISEIRVSDGAAAPVLLHFDPRATEAGRVGWILEDRFLRGALLEAMAESGVREIAPATLERVEFGPGPARLRLSDGSCLSAKLAVAADGRGSALARAARVGRIGWRYGQTGLVNAIAHERPHHGVAHQSFFPGGPFAVLPLTGDCASLVWSERAARAEALQRLDDAAFTAEIGRRIGLRLGRIRLLGPRRSFPLDLSLANRYAAPRLALVGDAAHGVHPIAGQGMNMGLRDVAALAEVLVTAARRGEDIGALDVLERYQRWRRFDATVMALGMDALNRLFSNHNPVLAVLRRAGLGAVDALPGVTRMLMREATGQAGEVPKLLQGRAL